MTALQLRLISLILATLACSLIANLVSAADNKQGSGKILKWVDEKGVTHYGDTVPAQYSNRDSTEMNKQGVVIKRNHVINTQSNNNDNQQALEQQRRDRALKAAYTKEEEIDLAKERNLQMDEASILGLQQSLMGAKNRLTANKKAVESYQKRKKPVPDDVTKELKETLAEITKIEGQIAERRKAIETTKQRFDNDKLRFRELTQKDTPSATKEPIELAPSQSVPVTTR
jgi:hypothetical protein